jgi:hypothetical protein
VIRHDWQGFDGFWAPAKFSWAGLLIRRNRGGRRDGREWPETRSEFGLFLADIHRCRAASTASSAARAVSQPAGAYPPPEIFGPNLIHRLGNALAPAQFRYAVLPAKPIQHNPDLVFRRIVLARSPADVLQNSLGERLGILRFCSHLRSSVVTMRPNFSLG